jgi:hypothetical protein
MSSEEEKKVSINVPEVTSDEVEEATELVETIADKYKMAEKDINAMFNAMVAIYVRNRTVYGDRKPTICGSSCAVGEEN